MHSLKRFFRWASQEAWEKINVVGTAKKLYSYRKKYGWRFFIPAATWTLFEDIVAPLLAWHFGVPELALLLLIIHFEWIVYPAIFWSIRTYDRWLGREPWEPDRSAQSSHWRSLCKVSIYKFALTGWLVMIMYLMGFSPKVMWVYVPLMLAFGFIHERIWHDSNYGINEKDGIEIKRIFAKTLTYTVVSTTILSSFFKAIFSSMPWHMLLACQIVTISMYVFFEGIWAHSNWGVGPVAKPIDSIEKLAENSWAACVLVLNEQGQVLILESPRRGYELPGGKKEPGESIVDAAKREMKEETGLANSSPLLLLYVAEGDSGKPVATYLTSSNGEPTSSREGRVFWGDYKLLLIETNTYASYNREVLKALGFV